VRVKHSSLELLDAIEVGHVGYMEVTRASEDPVKPLDSLFRGSHWPIGSVFDNSHFEVISLSVEFHTPDDSVEVNPVFNVGLFNAAIDVVMQDFTRRIGRDRLAEMFLERIISELKTLLRAIRPKVPVHARVNRLVMLIETGSPAVVPLATQSILFLKADDFRDVSALILS
jgi:hypothetical protein